MKKNKKDLLSYVTNPKDWKEGFLGIEIIYSNTKFESIISMNNVISHYLSYYGVGEEGIEINYKNND